jgi:hypothetical protein
MKIQVKKVLKPASIGCTNTYVIIFHLFGFIQTGIIYSESVILACNCAG